jgi:tRNA pseudouridine55 synthase
MKPIAVAENSLRLVDKPVGFSSFQIVRMLQKTNRKVGHGGTLDPFASGLLIILLNRATRQFTSIQQMEKEYSGEIVLGITTNTYDITGTMRESKRADIDFSLSSLNRIAGQFTGEIEQVPPSFSALKRQGRRLYELSRQNKPVAVAPRRVSVRSFEIELVDPPILKFRSVVGKGVYIRSLAHDFGKAAGCGACLMTLRRTRIGTYHVSQACTLGMIASNR